MPRRRARLTMKKKTRTTRKKGDPDVPTQEEWERMEPYHKFKLDDPEFGIHTFSVDDHILVRPEPMTVLSNDILEYWVGVIKEIRCENETTKDVWIQVQWFYSSEEAHDVQKSFDISHCGSHERIASNHVDFIHYTTVNDHGDIHFYQENDTQQPDIPRDEFYWRYTLDAETGKITPLQSSDACFCGISYNPDNTSLMRLCPRPNCLRWFHEKCLNEAGLFDTPADHTLSYSARLFLSSHPQSESISFRFLKPAQMFQGVPGPLLNLAQQPIIKGTSFKKCGIVGNVAYVTKARNLLYQVLDGESIASDWEENIDVQKASADAKSRKAMYICPRCKDAI